MKNIYLLKKYKSYLPGEVIMVENYIASELITNKTAKELEQKARNAFSLNIRTKSLNNIVTK